MANGITFGDKYHTYNDWGLKLLSLYIPTPAVKENYIDVPGMDGSIDLTDVLGRPLYSDRDGIEIAFDLLDGSYSKWFALCEKISSVLHGKKLKMVLDDENNRFYNVRLNIDYSKSDAVMSQIVLSGKAEPFKYDIQSTSEAWLWDSFSFINGVIQQLSDITITESAVIKLIGKGIGSNPIFVVNEAEKLQVTYNNNTYDLAVGNNRIPDIRIAEGEEAELVFSGTGDLAIDYRGEYL